MTATTDGYVTLLWDAKAKPGREDDLKAFISAAVTPSRNDPGNIDYEAHEVEGQVGLFVIYQRWQNRAFLDAHLRAPRTAALVLEILELIEGSVKDGISLLRPFRPTA